MNFPSIRSVFKGIFYSCRRFPVAILLAATATAFCLVWVHLSFDARDAHFWYWNIVGAAYLGMMLSIALTVLAEKRRLRRSIAAALQGGALLLAAGYYFTLPDHLMPQALIRFILFALGMHWLVASIGFIGSGSRGQRARGKGGVSPERSPALAGPPAVPSQDSPLQENPPLDNGFWLYNKRLFLRILTGALYTGVLYLGLVIALSAVEHLFHVDIDEKIYFDIWFVMAGVFNTWFFLAGFPADYESPEVIDEYPRGLKIFTQFVLLPILTTYLVILYAYMIRIAVTAVWPYGWVSYMVLAFSVAGILAILLVWPLRNEEGNKWIAGYSRFFYFALFPLVVLLAFAIWKRVAAYGITERRYFVLLLAGWLLLVALYFLVSKKKTIRMIPVSLCVVAFLAAFGPWGAEGVSLYSQRSRLQVLLEKDQVLANGKLTGKTVRLPLTERQQITELTEYIIRMHGYRTLQPWFDKDLDSLAGPVAASDFTGMNDQALRNMSLTLAALKEMKVRFANSYDSDDDLAEDFYADAERDANDAIVTTGYDYLVSGIYLTTGGGQVTIDSSHYQLGRYRLLVQMDTAANRLHLFPDKDSALTVDLSAVVGDIPAHNERQTAHMPREKMSVETANSQWGCRLVITRCDGQVRGDKKVLKSLSGYLLMKKK